MADPRRLARHRALRFAERGVTAFALELIPRITRAPEHGRPVVDGDHRRLQGRAPGCRYAPAHVSAADDAAGTITPAHVFIVGVGVAGLQAIATARKLGAVVEAYDVRPAVKEQVQSVGAKFVELPLETAQAEDKGGYAKAQDESFYQRQREMMARVVASNDVVITTAVVPGKKAPVLVTAEMVRGMAPARSSSIWPRSEAGIAS
jgi:NAD(P) transhydrogenase subunit alpha